MQALSLSSSITSLPSIPARLEIDKLKSLHPVKLFSIGPADNSGAHESQSHQALTPYTSITHNPQGSYFITTSPNGSLQLYDALRGRQLKSTYSKKYGCANATFTLRTATQSSPNSCIIASTIPAGSDPVSNNALRFLDLNTNSFIRYFQSHTEQVTSISASPSPVFGLDSFYSASIDGSVCAWDSRSEKCYARLSQVGLNPIIALDKSGTIMAIWNQSKLSLTIVPVEQFPVGVIGEIDVPQLHAKRVETLIWSEKGLLVLDSPGNAKVVVDTLKLQVCGILAGVTNFAIAAHSDEALRNGSTDITPDGTWCLAGSGDGSILAWNLLPLFQNTEKIVKLEPVEIKNDDLVSKQIVPRILKVNPKLGCVVTGDTEIVISMYDK